MNMHIHVFPIKLNPHQLTLFRLIGYEVDFKYAYKTTYVHIYSVKLPK
jgi:hypothetical protein